MADHLGLGGAAVGLCELSVTGQRVDDVAGQMRAVGRSQRSVLLALEVIAQDQFVVGLGKDQVDARSLEVAGEQQLRVRHHDRAGRKMPWNGLDMDLPTGKRAMGIQQLTVEFIGEAQKGITAFKVNIYRIFKRLGLHITGWNRTEPRQGLPHVGQAARVDARNALSILNM